MAKAVVRGGSTSPFDGDPDFVYHTASDPAGSEGRIEGWSGGADADAPRDEQTGEFSLRVPAGRTTLHVRAVG